MSLLLLGAGKMTASTAGVGSPSFDALNSAYTSRVALQWHSAGDSSTLLLSNVATSSGGVIDKWSDKSGGSRHATQASPITASDRPTRVTSLTNGTKLFDVVQFDSTDRLGLFSSKTVTKNAAYLSFFISFKAGSGDINFFQFQTGDGADRAKAYILASAGNKLFIQGTRTDGDTLSQADSGANVYVPNTWGVLCVVFDYNTATFGASFNNQTWIPFNTPMAGSTAGSTSATDSLEAPVIGAGSLYTGGGGKVKREFVQYRNAFSQTIRELIVTDMAADIGVVA